MVPEPSRLSFLATATATYAEQLAHSQAAIDYLALRRGLSEDSARSFKLGYVADPLPGHEKYRGRIAIPYLNALGTVSIRYRCMADHSCKETPGHAKYLSEPGDEVRPFNVHALTLASPRIAVAEGEFDTIASVEADIPTFGLPGVESWKKLRRYLRRALAGYDEVIVLADADDDGQGEGLAEQIMTDVKTARSRPMPKGFDVNAYFLDSGPQALRERAGF
ncbi:toprim domain-containing protein [Yinghuangia sp. YIM S09857]|uniref:toprim domain-containing protein n=1 Tax=Yinghuangia sp. YIM S09857 TaxID=3436929 RepID=UPI003F53E05A